MKNLNIHLMVGKLLGMRFFALQECGFGKGKKCEGDFHSAENYDLTQFGPEYR